MLLGHPGVGLRRLLNRYWLFGGLGALVCVALISTLSLARKPLQRGDDGGPIFPPEGFAGGAASAQAASADSGRIAIDAGSVKEQISRVDDKRKELEQVTQELDAERKKLEEQLQTQRGRESSVQLLAAIGLVLALGAGVWFWMRRKRE